MLIIIVIQSEFLGFITLQGWMEYSLIICTWHLMYFFHYFISLRTTDAICWHRHWSTLAQVMACCLTAPSHNLNHCWLKTRFISTCISRNILGKLHIKKYFFLVFWSSPRDQWVNHEQDSHCNRKCPLLPILAFAAASESCGIHPILQFYFHNLPWNIFSSLFMSRISGILR